MKRIASILAAALCATALSAQVYVTESPGLQQQIIGSGFIHSPLPVCRENSFETRSSAKDIVLDEPLGAKHSACHFATPLTEATSFWNIRYIRATERQVRQRTLIMPHTA